MELTGRASSSWSWQEYSYHQLQFTRAQARAVLRLCAARTYPTLTNSKRVERVAKQTTYWYDCLRSEEIPGQKARLQEQAHVIS